jgi:hypothetical protein
LVPDIVTPVAPVAVTVKVEDEPLTTDVGLATMETVGAVAGVAVSLLHPVTRKVSNRPQALIEKVG